jgi:hypothetical protein
MTITGTGVIMTTTTTMMTIMTGINLPIVLVRFLPQRD